MSYEGSVQCICHNGHYSIQDCYTEGDCPECRGGIAWRNDIDETNGESMGEIPFELLKEKYLITPADIQTCNLGHQHIVRPDIFRIPNKEDTMHLRHYLDPETDKLVPLYPDKLT